MRPGHLDQPLLVLRWAIALILSLAAFPQAARADIVVAGVWALRGGSTVQAVELAIDKINEGGGLLGEKVRLVSFDEGCSDLQGAAVAQLVLTAHPSLVIGHECSGPAIAAAPIYAAAGVVQIAPNATAPKLTEMGIGSVFRLIGRDDRQGAEAADKIARTWPHARIAVIEDGTLYGTGLADIVGQELRGKGIDSVATYTLTHDHAGILGAIKRDKVELIYFACNFTSDAFMFMRRLGKVPGLTILASDTATDLGDWRQRFGIDISLLYTSYWDPFVSPAAKALQAESQAKGVLFTSRAVRAYSVVELWADAVRRAGSVDAARVAEALHIGRFQTVIGEVVFDAQGDVEGPPAQWVWHRLGGS